MKGLIFHTLKGKIGWSHLKIIHIDVYKIIEISRIHKRWFCIFDKEHPYRLAILYNEPKESTGQIHQARIITRRYKTEMDVKNEIEEILKKQHQLQLLQTKFIN